MEYGKVTFILMMIVVSVGCIVKGEQKQIVVELPDTNKDVVINATIPVVVPIETPYLKPTYVPRLREYEIDKSSDIWHAKDPSSYITPNSEWVKYYSQHINEVQINYIEDKLNQNYPKPLVNDDYWQNADYTLYTMLGDCEDESMIWVSIHRALGHKAIVVAGELWFGDSTPNIRDYWYEYIDEFGVQNIKFVTPITQVKTFEAKPKYMFNDKIAWRSYSENWYLS